MPARAALFVVKYVHFRLVSCSCNACLVQKMCFDNWLTVLRDYF